MSLLMIVVLVILIILGVPLSIALAGSVLIALLLTGGNPTFVIQRIFTGMNSFTLMAVPFFMLSGSLMSGGGVTERLINLISIFLRKVYGGLAIVTSVACACFGALTGSAPATTTAIGSIMLPAMKEAGYDKGFALNCVACSGFLGALIPPSIVMVTYSVAANVSVSDMFIAGLVPGCLMCFLMCVYGYIVGKRNNYTVKNQTSVTPREVLSYFCKALPALFMPIIILGGIYSGFCTPTEAGCLAVIYGFFVGFFVYKELKIRDVPKVLCDAARGTAMVLLIMGCSTPFCLTLTMDLVPQKIAAAMLAFTDNRFVFLFLVNIMFLIVGMFMEGNSSIAILTPILAPVAQQMGIDLVHFGIIMCANILVGCITPPLGLNLFVACGLTGDTTKSVLNRHLAGFFAACLISLVLIICIPGISTYLPALIKS